MNTRNTDPVITSYANAPAKAITVGDTTFAYRELGPKGGIPVVFFVHLAGTLDNWDPRIVDPIAQTRHVIAFDQRGVGASTGHGPATLEEAADDAYAFVNALGYDKIDIFSFSMGGMIAQDLVVKHPDLVRKLVLTGTGPRGGKDMDKVIGTTYWARRSRARTRRSSCSSTATPSARRRARSSCGDSRSAPSTVTSRSGSGSFRRS